MRRGFTLIELLAVIVILAIIALITIPAILRMTDNAKVSSYRRSIDLYGRAINSAIAAYKSNMIEKKQPYEVKYDNVVSYIDYEGNDIDCSVHKIYSDDTILLTECTVEGNKVSAEKGKGYGNNNYYYYTNAEKMIKILDYIDQVNIALENKKNIGNTCEVQDNGNLVCNGQQIEVAVNIGKPKTGTLTISNNTVTSYTNLQFEEEKAETQQEVPTVIDQGSISTGDNQNNNNSENSNVPSYVGYYADVDSDGTVDGVIYADLAHSKSGSWGNNEFGVYSYESVGNLKEYEISENKYKCNDGFGEKEIITLKPGSSGKSRFYVMALNDFTTGAKSSGTYWWYRNVIQYLQSNPNAYTGAGRMTTWETDTSRNFGTGYTNTGKIIEIWNKNGTGEGSYIGATQNDYDIFKHIQGEYAKGWYIPSQGEWAAFADYLAHRETSPLTSDYNLNTGYTGNGNYDDKFGLSKWYWASSQYGTYSAWYVSFFDEAMNYNDAGSNYYVRLSYTF